MSVDVNDLFKDLGSLSQIEAIALGGSRVTGQNDASSDYDVYVYITAPFPKVSEGIFWVNTANIWK